MLTLGHWCVTLTLRINKIRSQSRLYKSETCESFTMRKLFCYIIIRQDCCHDLLAIDTNYSTTTTKVFPTFKVQYPDYFVYHLSRMNIKSTKLLSADLMVVGSSS